MKARGPRSTEKRKTKRGGRNRGDASQVKLEERVFTTMFDEVPWTVRDTGSGPTRGVGGAEVRV